MVYSEILTRIVDLFIFSISLVKRDDCKLTFLIYLFQFEIDLLSTNPIGINTSQNYYIPQNENSNEKIRIQFEINFSPIRLE